MVIPKWRVSKPFDYIWRWKNMKTEILRLNEAYNELRSMKKKIDDATYSDIVGEREKEDLQHLKEQIENILDESEEGVDEFIEAQADAKREEKMEAEQSARI